MTSTVPTRHWLRDQRHRANCHCHDFLPDPDHELRMQVYRQSDPFTNVEPRPCMWYVDGSPCDATAAAHPFVDDGCRWDAAR